MSEWEELMANGAVQKRVLRTGTPPCPEFNQFVYIQLISRDTVTNEIVHNCFGDEVKYDDLLTRSVDSKLDEDIQKQLEERSALPGVLVFPIGDVILQEADHGVMLAVKTMNLGEICECKVNSRFTFDHEHDLIYIIELLKIGDFEKLPMELPSWDIFVQIRYINRYKDRGNYFFKLPKPDYIGAERCYSHCVKLCEAVINNEFDPDPPEEIIDIYIKCLSNLSAAQERLGKYKHSIETCVKILENDPSNLKALMRISRISRLEGNFAESKLAIARAQESQFLVDNGQAMNTIALEREALKQDIRTYKLARKENYGGFLSAQNEKNQKENVLQSELNEDENDEKPPQQTFDKAQNAAPSNGTMASPNTPNEDTDIGRQIGFMNIIVLLFPILIAVFAYIAFKLFQTIDKI